MWEICSLRFRVSYKCYGFLGFFLGFRFEIKKRESPYIVTCISLVYAQLNKPISLGLYIYMMHNMWTFVCWKVQQLSRCLVTKCYLAGCYCQMEWTEFISQTRQRRWFFVCFFKFLDVRTVRENSFLIQLKNKCEDCGMRSGTWVNVYKEEDTSTFDSFCGVCGVHILVGGTPPHFN